MPAAPLSQLIRLALTGKAGAIYAALGLGGLFILYLLAIGKVPLRYNLRNLSLRWKTTIMTALAFTLVIGLLTVMLAFVGGMYRLTESSGQPGNVMLLGEGSTDESFSSIKITDAGEIENQKGILHEDGKPLCSREAFLIINQPLRNREPGRPERRFLQVRGVDDPLISGRVHGLELHPGGEWFSDAGVQQAGDGPSLYQAVLGEGVSRLLGDDRTPEEKAAAKNAIRLDTGDQFDLGGRTWIVTGVLKSTGSTFDSEVWAKRGLVGPAFGKTTYSSMVLRTADADEATTLKNFFVKDYKKASITALTEAEYFTGLSDMNKQFLYAIIFVAIIMAIGGIFGVMNTMFAAINQRRTDIGVLRLLGYSRKHVLISFLIESVVIAIIGGVLGLAIGSLSHGISATSVVSSGQGGFKTVVLNLEVSELIIAGGLLLTLVMGILGGLIPSYLATGLKPLDALR